MGLDFDQLFPGRFLKAGMFKGQDATLTIKAIELEVLDGEKKKETKGIISFVERPQQLALNKTNGLCLKAMFGRDTANWIGKRVTFYPAENTSDVGDEFCIRVRGSPDLAAPIEAEIKLARKKPRKMVLQRTALRSTGSRPPAAQQNQVPANKPSPVAIPRTDSGRVPTFDPGQQEEPPLAEPPADMPLPGQPDYDRLTGELPFTAEDGLPHS